MKDQTSFPYYTKELKKRQNKINQSHFLSWDIIFELPAFSVLSPKTNASTIQRETVFHTTVLYNIRIV